MGASGMVTTDAEVHGRRRFAPTVGFRKLPKHSKETRPIQLPFAHLGTRYLQFGSAKLTTSKSCRSCFPAIFLRTSWIASLPTPLNYRAATSANQVEEA
jgi:hypothetical protein